MIAIENTMTSTSDGDWAEISALFDSIIELPAAARASALGRSIAAASVMQQVEVMIAALETAPDFLSQPPVLHSAASQAGNGWISKARANTETMRIDVVLDDLDVLAATDETCSTADGIASAFFLISQQPCSEE